MPPAPPPVSDAELEVLKVLWEHAPLTVRQIETLFRRRKNRWAYNTILTLLSRLRAKGHVAQERAATGAAFLFRAAVSRQDLVGQGLTALADRMCDGTASPLMQALVQGNRLSAQEIAVLRKMLDQMQERK